MLQKQYRAPNHTITAAELARAMGYASYSAANLRYGKLGRFLAEALSYTPPVRSDGTPRYWTTLAQGNPDLESGEDFQWIMRPELATALEELKLV